MYILKTFSEVLTGNEQKRNVFKLVCFLILFPRENERFYD